MELVAISEAQRAKAPLLPWVATVTNAIRVESFPFHREKEEFALFLGRRVGRFYYRGRSYSLHAQIYGQRPR